MGYYTLVQRGLERFLRAGRNLTAQRVLMLHQVTDQKNNWYDPDYAISAAGFKDMLLIAESEGYSFGRIDDIFSADQTSDKKLYVTFDDGFEGVYNEAVPILNEFAIPYCVFLTTGFIGRDGYITKDMLISMASDERCTIGAHTVNHPNLRSCRDADFEIAECRRNLQDWTGKEISYFAYPFGCLLYTSYQRCNSVYCKYLRKYPVQFLRVIPNLRYLSNAIGRNTKYSKYKKGIHYGIRKVDLSLIGGPKHSGNVRGGN